MATDLRKDAMSPSRIERLSVLSIAGYDPSSGAGITADLKVFAAYRLFGVSCITALTVQSTQGVRRTEAVSGGWIADTLQCLQEDIDLAGVKIGMLATAENTLATAKFLARSGIAKDRIVLDPVLVSSSGMRLLQPAGIACMRETLLPQVGWVTPNTDELAALTGATALDREQVPEAASQLQRMISDQGHPALNVLVTGGHLEKPDDYLLAAGTESGVWVSGEKVETTASHGTGCALSSALLCEVCAGLSPVQAVSAAKRYVEESLRRAYKIGHGRGPMHHLHAYEAL